MEIKYLKRLLDYVNRRGLNLFKEVLHSTPRVLKKLQDLKCNFHSYAAGSACTS